MPTHGFFARTAYLASPPSDSSSRGSRGSVTFSLSPSAGTPCRVLLNLMDASAFVHVLDGGYIVPKEQATAKADFFLASSAYRRAPPRGITCDTVVRAAPVKGCGNFKHGTKTVASEPTGTPGRTSGTEHTWTAAQWPCRRCASCAIARRRNSPRSANCSPWG